MHSLYVVGAILVQVYTAKIIRRWRKHEDAIYPSETAASDRPEKGLMEQYNFVIQSAIAGILASLACGLGSLPLLVKTLDVERKVGLGYGFAVGLMLSDSVYNLLLPALNLGETTISLGQVILTLGGIFSGAGFL